MRWNWRQWPWTKKEYEIVHRTHTFGTNVVLDMKKGVSMVVCSCGKVAVTSKPPLGFCEVSDG